MNEHKLGKGSNRWEDARIERALFTSGQRVPPTNERRKAEMLQALLAESARLASAAQTNTAPEETVASVASVASIVPDAHESLAWDDSRIEQTLFESGQQALPLSEQRKSNALQALLAENARLAAETKTVTASVSQPVIAASGLSWDDSRVEQTLFESGQRAPSLSDKSKSLALQALLAENARLAAEAKIGNRLNNSTCNCSEWSELG